MVARHAYRGFLVGGAATAAFERCRRVGRRFVQGDARGGGVFRGEVVAAGGGGADGGFAVTGSGQ